MSEIPNKDERIKSEQAHIASMKQMIAFCEQSIKTSEEAIGRLKESTKPPDDVRDVPRAIIGVEFADSGTTYRRYRVSSGMIFGEYISSAYKTSDIYFFMTERFARIFREKSELIAKCLWFKWLYDRDFVPDWKDNSCKYGVCMRNGNFDVDLVRFSDFNAIYFSSIEIAQKCVEWLNMLEEKNEA